MEMRGDVTDAGRRRTNEQTLKIELLSQWKLEAEFRNISGCACFLTLEMSFVNLNVKDTMSGETMGYFESREMDGNERPFCCKAPTV